MSKPQDRSRESARTAILSLSGRNNRHGQTNNKRGDAKAREDGGANRGGEGEGEGEEIKEAESNDLSINQGLRPSNPMRKQDNRRKSARVPSHTSRHGQTRDERGDEHVHEEVGDGGADQEKEKQREVKDAEGNELSTNQGSPSASNPVSMPHRRRESARDAILRLEGTLKRRENDVYVLSTRNEQLSNEIKILKEESTRLQLERDQARQLQHEKIQSTQLPERDQTRQLLHERTIELSSAQLERDQTKQLLHERTVELSSAQLEQDRMRQLLHERKVELEQDQTRQLLYDRTVELLSAQLERDQTRQLLHDKTVELSSAQLEQDQTRQLLHERTVELSSVQLERDQLRQLLHDKKVELSSAQLEQDRTRKLLHERKVELSSAQLERDQTRQLLHERTVELSSTQLERDRARQLLHERTVELSSAQLERDQARQLLHEKTVKPSSTQLERDQTGQLRTIELSRAQLFLGKSDIISVADVSKMVDILNAEISQASNSIADSLFDHQEAPATPDTAELNQLLYKVRSSIGARLCGILARRLSQPNAEFNPMITQLVLQAGLSEACYLTINDWNPPLRDTSSTLNRIYANMRPTVGQVIAGRWRALTRTYINGYASQDSEDGIQASKERIREANANHLRSTLRDLLTIVGWTSKGPHHDLPSEYKEKMRFLSDEALKLHKTIGEGITSKDLIVDLIPCETPFDPTKMDDANRQRGKPHAIRGDTVACTVELGLRYKYAKPGEDSEEIGMILKPKVLLASVLVEEDTEVIPPKPQN